MKLIVTRVDGSLPLPAYQTEGAVAFDVYARVETTVAPGELVRIPTNLIVCVPAGHALLLAARSSTAKKYGLQLPNAPGIIDQDFCGPEDEMQVQVVNFTDAPCTVKRGERFAQAMLVPAVRAEIAEGAPASNASRGGFGSTG